MTGEHDDDSPGGGGFPVRVRHLSSRAEERLFDDDSPSLDQFGSLLAVTVLAVVALSLIDLDAISSDVARGMLGIVLSLTTGVALVLALRASGVAKRWRRVAEYAVVFAFLTSVIVLLVEQFAGADTGAWQSERPSPLWLLIALVTPIAVVRRLVTHRTVSGGTLAGAIAAYLLIAIAWCYLFLYVDSLRGGGFFESGDVASNEFMYFSLVSITTVGYGDLTPAAPLGRLLATSEAVVGQVYLVTFVAMLVGLMIQQRDGDGRSD